MLMAPLPAFDEPDYLGGKARRRPGLRAAARKRGLADGRLYRKYVLGLIDMVAQGDPGARNELALVSECAVSPLCAYFADVARNATAVWPEHYCISSSDNLLTAARFRETIEQQLCYAAAFYYPKGRGAVRIRMGFQKPLIVKLIPEKAGSKP